MKKYIVLYGATGYVGSYVKKILAEEFTILEMKRRQRIKINKYAAGIVGFVNCAGYAGEVTVDDCFGNQDKLQDSNVDLLKLIIDELNSIEKEIPLIHVSTGCVFTKQIGAHASHTPNNLNIYTYSKLQGEEIIKQGWRNSLILRPRLIFSDQASLRNPLFKVAAYESVLTSPESATPLHEFAVNIKLYLQSLINVPLDLPEIVHSVCTCPLNWFEIALEMHKKGLRNDRPKVLSSVLFDNTSNVQRSSVVLDNSQFRQITLPNNAQNVALNLLDSLKNNMSIQ